MKKSALLSLILMVVVAAFTFSACGEKKPDTEKNETNPPANEVENIKKDPVVYSVFRWALSDLYGIVWV